MSHKKTKPSRRCALLRVLAALLALCCLSACTTDYDAGQGSSVAGSEQGSAPAVAVADSDEASEGGQAEETDADEDAQTSGELVVHFIDVGQGDATFVELPDGTCMLIDAGTFAAAGTVKSYIKKLGYSKIDYLVATHPDADHIGGLASVIQAFDVGEVWAPDATNDTATFEGFLDAVDDAGLQIDVAEEGIDIVSNADGCSVEVLGPSASEDSESLNDHSIVLLIEFGDTSFLLTGDASSDKIPAVDVDVLKVSHHGSNTGTTTSLVKELSPKIAVISYGADNDYGHPTQKVLDALAAADAEVYGTAVNGDVVVTSDGEDLSVEVESEGAVEAAEDSTDDASGGASSGNGSSDASGASADDDSSDGESEVVYVTATGTKYHTANCRYARGKDNLASMTKAEAEAAGYEACAVCDP